MGLFSKKIKSSYILEKIEKKYKVRRYLELVFGILIVSVAYNLFFLPNNLVFGGVSGLAIIVKELIPIPPFVFIFISSIVLLIISLIMLGKSATRNSIIGSMLFPLFVELTANINNYLNIDTSNLLLCALFGGVIYGFGAGLVFKAGFTTGGTDILNQILAKYCHIGMGTAMLLSDGLIVLSSYFFFGATRLMYAMVVLYIIGYMTDKVLLGISSSKAFYIVTDYDDEIKNYVINELHHSVTIFNVKGGFTEKKKEVLLCVVPTNEYYRLKEGIHEIDPDAFFVVTDAYEVFGGE